jgi:hypothetical protein
MEYFYTIKQMFPNVNTDNIEIVVYPDETWKITKWDLPDQQPTNEEVEAYWNANQLEILDSKSKKKSVLSEQCNTAIVSGFKSSALGVEHTYPSDMEAQANFNTIMNRFIIDSNFTSVAFKTLDAGYLSHTKGQFFQVFEDGHNYGAQQIQHLNELKVQVDSAQTQADLDAITW